LVEGRSSFVVKLSRVAAYEIAKRTAWLQHLKPFLP
jgi:hypothetical protein